MFSVVKFDIRRSYGTGVHVHGAHYLFMNLTKNLILSVSDYNRMHSIDLFAHLPIGRQ